MFRARGQKPGRFNNPVWRGVHLGLHGDKEASSLIEQLPKLSALGVNVLVVEVNYSFDYHRTRRFGQGNSSPGPAQGNL